jgi:hypothetical protein
MRRLLSRIPAAAIALAFGVAAAAPAEPAPTLVVRTGPVELRRGGTRRLVAPGAWTLDAGDRIVAGQGADALVAAAAGVKLLRAGEPWIAPAADAAPTSGARRLIGALFAWNPVHERAVAGARVESSDQLAAAFPADGDVVLDERPDLIWNEPRGRHRITVRCGGETVLDLETAKGRRVRFPPDAPSLRRGAHCEWRVSDADDPARMDVSRFTVATHAAAVEASREAKRVRADTEAAGAPQTTVQLAVAGQFLSAGYRHAAAVELLRAAEAAPTDPELAFAVRWWIDR